MAKIYPIFKIIVLTGIKYVNNRRGNLKISNN